MSNSLREALSDATSVLEDILDAFSRGEGGVYKSDVAEAIDNARAALAQPRKNCEVGTPEEQSQRFDAFCVSHYTPPNKDGVVPDGCDCPCYTRGKGCNAFAWGQLPYVEKEVGAK